MVIYFSGTGNSKYAAEQIAQKTGDELVSLGALLKQNRTDALVSNGKPFVFVCPTYSWRIPRVVDNYIRNTTFEGSKKVYFILTCGGETANAIHHVRKLCSYKGWELLGFAEVLMPDNYIVMFPSPEIAATKALTQKAMGVIDQIAEDIRAGKRFDIHTAKGLMDKMKSGYVNSLFYRFMVRAKGFYATDKCIGCGKCAQLCPLGNITMHDGKPVWGEHCTHCMACICGCPSTAIEYKNKTQGKLRYWFSED